MEQTPERREQTTQRAMSERLCRSETAKINRLIQHHGKPVTFKMGDSKLVPTRWEDPRTGARIERTSRVDRSPSFAVRMHGNCLSRDGEWELEPQPSSRDQAFLDQHRWSNLAEAERALHCADYSPFFGPES